MSIAAAVPMCCRDAIPRLVSGIQLSRRRVGISSPLPPLGQAACPLCKPRQGCCCRKPLSCRRTPVLASLLSVARSCPGGAAAQRAVEIRRGGRAPGLVIQPRGQKERPHRSGVGFANFACCRKPLMSCRMLEWCVPGAFPRVSVHLPLQPQSRWVW